MGDSWELNTEQMIFMMQHHNEIADAYFNDDMQSLRDLAATKEFKSIFGKMSFDKAYDIYEETLAEVDDPLIGFKLGMLDLAHGRVIPYPKPPSG